MSFLFEDPAERERRRWTQPNAHLWMRHDAHRFIRPDDGRFLRPGQKLDRYWERPEYLSPAMRAYAPPEAPARVARHAEDHSSAAPAAPLPKSGPSYGELLKLKSDLAALRVQLAVIRHAGAVRTTQGLPPLTKDDPGWRIILTGLARYEDACRKAGFNPAQPRDERGRWTDGGGASGGGINDPRVLSDATPENQSIPGRRYAQNESARHRSVVLEDEPRFDHINNKHIARSDSELLDRLRGSYYRGVTLYGFQPAEGSFSDVRSGNDLINQTLQANSALVDQVAAGQVLEATLEHRLGYPTGKEAFRPDVDADPYIRKTYGVRVVIRHDPQSRRGYRLVTAFPVNERKRR
jgi:hypothetical protein